MIVIQIIRLRVRKLQRDKQILEHKVLERTAEIQRQKDEIAEQKKETKNKFDFLRKMAHLASEIRRVFRRRLAQRLRARLVVGTSSGGAWSERHDEIIDVRGIDGQSDDSPGD